MSACTTEVSCYIVCLPLYLLITFVDDKYIVFDGFSCIHADLVDIHSLEACAQIVILAIMHVHH